MKEHELLKGRQQIFTSGCTPLQAAKVRRRKHLLEALTSHGLVVLWQEMFKTLQSSVLNIHQLRLQNF